jgi:hypothetical protein
MNEISKYDLARSYTIATQRIHNLVIELYESFFDDNGDPIEHPGKVANNIVGYRQKINLEFDMIREAAQQAYEANYGISAEEELL